MILRGSHPLTTCSCLMILVKKFWGTSIRAIIQLFSPMVKPEQENHTQLKGMKKKVFCSSASKISFREKRRKMMHKGLRQPSKFRIFRYITKSLEICSIPIKNNKSKFNQQEQLYSFQAQILFFVNPTMKCLRCFRMARKSVSSARTQ